MSPGYALSCVRMCLYKALPCCASYPIKSQWFINRSIHVPWILGHVFHRSKIGQASHRSPKPRRGTWAPGHIWPDRATRAGPHGLIKMLFGSLSLYVWWPCVFIFDFSCIYIYLSIYIYIFLSIFYICIYISFYICIYIHTHNIHGFMS